MTLPSTFARAASCCAPQPSAKGAKEAVRFPAPFSPTHPCHAPLFAGAMSPAAHEKKRKGLELVSFLVAHKEKKYFVELRHSQKITDCQGILEKPKYTLGLIKKCMQWFNDLIFN